MGKISAGFTTGGRGEDILLREYVDSLDGVAKSRYLNKLKVLGLAATHDPYASSDFQNAMRLWPPVEFGHIFCYFIERPGVYTRQELLQWKELEAYNYFKSGFVRTVEVWDLRNSSPWRRSKEGFERTPSNPHVYGPGDARFLGVQNIL